MFTRKRIYDRFRKLSKKSDIDNLIFTFYSEIMTAENTGGMVEHFQNMVTSIIEEGTAIPIPAQQMARRKQLGLPEFYFDKEEIKKIVKKSMNDNNQK
jgi:hypothetical protein